MTHKRTYLAARALLLIVASIGPTAALAQTTAAQITGIVKDPTGAMIPGANVRIENQQTGNFLLTVTSDEGRYLFRSLEPGNYSLTVSMPAFKTQTLTDVVLHVAQTARLDIALEVGQPSETLTVTETTPLLESEGAAVGSIITTQQLTELPLNGRNFVGLAILAPGATNGFSNNYQTYFFGNRSETSVVQANGVRSEFTSTTIDGINTQTIDRHWTSVIYPSIDMIKEFKAETSNYLADTSGGGGVNLNVATKSGTNEIHGTAFEFLQNRALNARNFFLPANRSKPDEKYNQFGFTVGGPVIKNRTFYFVSYQGLRIRTSFINRFRVPTDKERSGDFSEILAAGRIVRDPETTKVDTTSSSGYSRDPFPGNIIPAARQNATSLKIIELGYPRATQALDVLNTSNPDYNINFVQTGARPNDSNQWSFRVDHRLSEKDNLFGRWTQERYNALSPGILDGTGSSNLNNAYSSVVGWNHAFSPELLNEFRVGFNRAYTGGAGFPAGQNIMGTEIPIKGLENIPPDQKEGLCCFRINGFPSPNYGSAPSAKPENMYQFDNKVLWTRGKHSIFFGGGVRQNEDYPALANNLLATWTFRSSFTGNPFNANTAQNPDIGTDLWLGLSDELAPQLQFTPKARGYWYQHQLDLYFNDQIRLRPNLTLSLGLRYTFWDSLQEKDNQFSRFDYATGSLIYPEGSPSIEPFKQYFTYKYSTDGPNQLFDMPKNNWQPNISLAFSPWGPKTVIRGGYARYYATASVANLVSIITVPPFLIGGQRNTTPLYVSDAFSIDQPAVPPNVSIETFAQPSLQLGDNPYRPPVISTWNLDIQHQLSRSMVASIGYVGNSADNINSVTRPNSPPPGAGPLDCPYPQYLNAPATCRRPYPDIGRIIAVSWNGISNYHGVQANLTRRFTDGLMFTTSYAYGKTLGTVDELVEINGGNLNMWTAEDQRKYDYGRNSYDFRHVFRASSIWQVPVGRAQKFLPDVHPVVDAIIGGWQLSGILTFQSAQAASVYGGFNLNDQRTNRPDRICDGNLSSGRTLLADIDTSCFVNQGTFRYGTSGRNIFSQRPLNNLDLALQKYFPVPIPKLENARLQFRAEMFNATNTPFFYLPNASSNSATFGRITATERPNRTIQMGVKLTL